MENQFSRNHSGKFLRVNVLQTFFQKDSFSHENPILLLLHLFLSETVMKNEKSSINSFHSVGDGLIALNSKAYMVGNIYAAKRRRKVSHE
jgi:hypothetical protein